MRRLVLVAVFAMAGCGMAVEREARSKVGEQLFDPLSAQYRSIRANDDLICGEVNAKNRMGGYVGFRKFIVDRDTGEATVDPGEPVAIHGDADLAKAYSGVIVLAKSAGCPS